MASTEEEQPLSAPGAGRRSYAQSEILKEDDTKIDYFKLLAHIKSNHPVDENDQAFSIFTPIGTFRFCGGRCSRGQEGRDGGFKITRVQQQLGLGPVLMLMTTKSLAWLFLFLSFINIPVYVIYSQGGSGSQRTSY